MEKFVEQTLLYDFYGELLTERQQQIYESVVLEDYSLSEVAEELGISRQGVHDMIKPYPGGIRGKASFSRKIYPDQGSDTKDPPACRGVPGAGDHGYFQ